MNSSGHLKVKWKFNVFSWCHFQWTLTYFHVKNYMRHPFNVYLLIFIPFMSRTSSLLFCFIVNYKFICFQLSKCFTLIYKIYINRFTNVGGAHWVEATRRADCRLLLYFQWANQFESIISTVHTPRKPDATFCTWKNSINRYEQLLRWST